MNKSVFLLAVLLAAPVVALAQKPVTQTDSVELTAKIDAIDRTARLVTLTDKDGNSQTIYCGPEVKRFDELKVGDTISFRYYESVAVAIRKPGEPGAKPAASDPKLVRGTGPKPGGTISQQATATVTIKSIDTKVPAVSVVTSDGHTVDFKVADGKTLAGYKAGDKVDITYTQALMISVK